MKKILLISVCSVVLLGSVARALPFEKPVLVKTGMHRLATMLPSYNEALDKALKVHNLMTEIPALQVIEAQRSKIVSTEKGIKQMYDSLMKCNEQRFGRFKNAKEVLAKVRGEYEKQRAGVVADSGIDENSLVPAYIMFQSKLYSRKKAIE